MKNHDLERKRCEIVFDGGCGGLGFDARTLGVVGLDHGVLQHAAELRVDGMYDIAVGLVRIFA